MDRIFTALKGNPQAVSSFVLFCLAQLATLGVVEPLGDPQRDALAGLVTSLLAAATFVWAMFQCPPDPASAIKQADGDPEPEPEPELIR